MIIKTGGTELLMQELGEHRGDLIESGSHSTDAICIKPRCFPLCSPKEVRLARGKGTPGKNLATSGKVPKSSAVFEKAWR